MGRYDVIRNIQDLRVTKDRLVLMCNFRFNCGCYSLLKDCEKNKLQHLEEKMKRFTRHNYESERAERDETFKKFLDFVNEANAKPHNRNMLVKLLKKVFETRLQEHAANSPGLQVEEAVVTYHDSNILFPLSRPVNNDFNPRPIWDDVSPQQETEDILPTPPAKGDVPVPLTTVQFDFRNSQRQNGATVFRAEVVVRPNNGPPSAFYDDEFLQIVNRNLAGIREEFNANRIRPGDDFDH